MEKQSRSLRRLALAAFATGTGLMMSQVFTEHPWQGLLWVGFGLAFFGGLYLADMQDGEEDG